MNMSLVKSAIALVVAACIGYAIRQLQPCTLKRDPATLVIGTAAGYAPFVSINAAGDYEGFDIDAARALAERMGKELVLNDVGSMTALFTALDQGSIDAVMWALSITDDRLQKVAMVHYQGELTTAYPLLFWQRIPDNVQTLEDMSGKTIAVEVGSSQDMVLDRYPAITKYPIEKVDDALLYIQYGKVDAALVEPAIARKFSDKLSEVKTLNVPLASNEQVRGMGIAVQKDNRALIQDLEIAVQSLKDDGTLQRLETRWNIP